MSFLNHELYIEHIDTYIDPPGGKRQAIITHGHADHARYGHKTVIATPDTIAIMKVRYGDDCAENFHALDFHEPLQIDDVTVTLIPAGHILGSAQVLLECNGTRIVVSGDFKRGADPTCKGFEPVACDIFVTEATFGLPVFQHPDPRDEIRKLIRSVKNNPDRAHIVGAYALGKAQRVIGLLREEGYDEPLYLHGAQVKLCEFYEDRGIDLGELRKATIRDRTKDDFKGTITIAPPSAMKDRWSRRFPDPILCMASGWMTVKQRARQRGVELPLVISDHADWTALIQTIKDTGAQKIWVTHGREDALVYFCRKTLGLEAAPLSIQGRTEESEE